MRLVVISAIIAGFIAASGCEAIPGTPWHKIAKGKEAAAALLIDPSSAQFRDVRPGNEGAVCGEINGKNRMAAYVGFTRFFVTDTGEAFLEEATTYTQADFDEQMRDVRRSLDNPYGSSLARYQLDRAKEINEALYGARVFAAAWARSCDKPAPTPPQPTSDTPA